MSRARVARAARGGPPRLHGRWSKVVGDTAPYLSVLTFLRVIAESTVRRDDHPGRRRPGRGAPGSRSARRHRDHGRDLLRPWSGCRPRTLGATAQLVGSPWRLHRLLVWLSRLLGPFSRLLVALANAVTPGKGFRDGPFATRGRAARPRRHGARDSALIEAGEREMIHSVFELGDTLAREVMVPRTDMVVDRATTGVCRQAMTLFLRSGFSRIPVRRRGRRRHRRAALPQGRRPAAQRRPRGRRRAGRAS